MTVFPLNVNDGGLRHALHTEPAVRAEHNYRQSECPFHIENPTLEASELIRGDVRQPVLHVSRTIYFSNTRSTRKGSIWAPQRME
jgi:hypothetical protein